VICPACHEQNDPLALVCFHCESSLTGHAIHRGKVIGGRYEVLKWLGRGGMGAVYQVFDRVLEEEVAVKVLRAEVAASTDLTRRFRSEIKLARRVRQPNVCAIHEYGEDGDLRFISMELIDGTDLKRLIQASGRFETEEAFGITRQIAEGLKAIHAIGVIHRDLKAANIMLDQRRQVHVMDFGIAKQFGPQAAASATITGHILGTPEYMSPEQARGQPLDPRTDIYALGVVMFEIFTGEVPFQGETPVATLFKQLQDPPPVSDPRLPPPLSSVLGKALAKEARDRYASVADFIEALDIARRETQELRRSAESPDVITMTTERPAIAVAEVTVTPATTIVPSLTASHLLTAAVGHGGDTPTDILVPRVGITPSVTPPGTHLETTLPPASPVPLPLPLPLRSSPEGTPLPPLPTSHSSGSNPAPHHPIDASFPHARHYALGAAALLLVTVVVAGALSRHSGSRVRETVVPSLSPVGPPTTVTNALSSSATAGSSTAVAPSATSAHGIAREAKPGEATRATISRSEPSTRSRRPHDSAESNTNSADTSLPTVNPPQTQSTGDPLAERGAPSVPKIAEEFGLLQVVARPWADISVDGTAVGTTPFRALKVAAGKHVVVFTHPDYKPFRRQVVVRVGETSRLEVDLSWEAFRK
jgi:serine/threonine protein kinase